MAAPTVTTPTAAAATQFGRRLLFHATACTLVAGAAVTAATIETASAQAHPDAELIATCEEALQLERQYRAFYDGPDAIEDDNARDAAIVEIAYTENRREVFDRILDLPAQTLAGVQAKACVVTADQPNYRSGSFDGDEMVASLLDDLIAIGGPKGAAA